jgi:hydrogenase maturation factor
MKEGKIPYGLLLKILDKYSVCDNTMIKGPGIGIDCAVFNNEDQYIVATSDPVTYISSGEYCINVNVNDIAAMGADPWFFMATILIPPKSTEEELENIMQELKAGCERFKINFAGGHTEINPIVIRPLISGFMVGKCRKDQLKGAFKAQDDDILLLTKGVSIEGTSIIAEIKKTEVIKRFGLGFYKKCLKYREKLSVLEEARLARNYANAMHDITEGGLVNGLYEIAVASGVSIELEELPILDECKLLCGTYKLNPLGLISAGTLAITTKKRELKDILKNNGIDVYQVGKLIKDGKTEVRYKGNPLVPFKADEILKISL